MKTPLISVIMPVYNAEKYVAEAIESILSQTFRDFEFLIFNDGSTDKSAEIVQYYANKDERIIFYNYTKNTGYLKHLNEGIDKAQGKYIARMDADDISLPQRFEKQVEFMESHEDIGVCGTWFTTFENHIENTITVMQPFEKDSDIKIAIFHSCPFGHPTVMAKTEVLKQNKYDINFYPAEDYELWSRLIPITKFYNIQENLLFYRIHETNITKSKSHTQQDNGVNAQLQQLLQLGLETNMCSKEDIKTLFPLHQFRQQYVQIESVDEVIRIANILQKMYVGNKKQQLYDSQKFTAFLTIAWHNHLSLELFNYNIKLLITYLSFPLPTLSLFSWKEKVKFVVKCLVHWKTRI